MRSLRFDPPQAISFGERKSGGRDRYGSAFVRRRLITHCVVAACVVALCALGTMTFLCWDQWASSWATHRLSILIVRLLLLASACMFIAVAAAYVFYLSTRKLVSDLSGKILSMRTISSDMGHELSAPLNSLMYRLSMLQDQVVSDEVRNHVKISNEACSRLTSLVTECRTLGSYDDMSHAQLSLMRMDHLVRDAVAEMQILFDSRDINLCIGQLDAATVMGNREGLTRVITNLLSNALRYGKPQGCVCVCVTKEARTVHLIVRDDGEGIPSEDLPHLFERYYRANRSADTEGSGLGLAIVKAVVDGHGGSVTVSSELGNGTRFEVAIPKFSNQIFMGLPLLREW